MSNVSVIVHMGDAGRKDIVRHYENADFWRDFRQGHLIVYPEDGTKDHPIAVFQHWIGVEKHD